MITTSNGIFFPNGFQLQFKRWCQKIKPLISFLKGIYTWNWKLPWVCCWSQTLVDNELNKVFLTEEFFRFIVLIISLDIYLEIEPKFDNYSEWNIIVYDIGINRTVVQYLIIFRPLLTFGSEFKTTFFPFPFSYCFILCGSYPFYDSKCLSSHFNKENKNDIGNTPETAVCIESSFCFIHRHKVNMLPDRVRVLTFEIILFRKTYSILTWTIKP